MDKYQRSIITILMCSTFYYSKGFKKQNHKNNYKSILMNTHYEKI